MFALKGPRARGGWCHPSLSSLPPVITRSWGYLLVFSSFLLHSILPYLFPPCSANRFIHGNTPLFLSSFLSKHIGLCIIPIHDIDIQTTRKEKKKLTSSPRGYQRTHDKPAPRLLSPQWRRPRGIPPHGTSTTAWHRPREASHQTLSQRNDRCSTMMTLTMVARIPLLDTLSADGKLTKNGNRTDKTIMFVQTC